MKRLTLVLPAMAVVALALLSGGCATQAGTGAVVGGAIGAGTGAVVGNDMDRRDLGR
jgi:hypothetical protein